MTPTDYPKTVGCNQGPDIMRQIKVSRRAKGRPFEDVAKELGI